MTVLYFGLAVLSILATFVLSNLFWRGFREARGIAMLLGDAEALSHVLTVDLVTAPPAEIAGFIMPASTGHQDNLRFFRQADEVAQGRLRSMLRLAIAAVIVGGGVFGFLSIGWFGLVVPVVNIFIMQATFVGSTKGAIDSHATASAVTHVQVLGVILSRWQSKDPTAAAAWVAKEPTLKTLFAVVANFQKT